MEEYEVKIDKKELAVYVGKRIRYFRKKKGLTQKELGELIGKTHNTVSNYETGTISPEQDALFAISRALDCTLDDLFPLGEGDDSLDRAVSLSDDDLDFEDLEFLNKLIRKAKTLKGDERRRFISNIKVAVELFDDGNE